MLGWYLAKIIESVKNLLRPDQHNPLIFLNNYLPSYFYFNPHHLKFKIRISRLGKKNVNDVKMVKTRTKKLNAQKTINTKKASF